MATRKRRSATAQYSSPACYLQEFEPESADAAARGFDIKRIYAPRQRGDGYRVLVDRLWPRGVSRRRAALDAWLPEIAPSIRLRQWFHRDASRWPEFGRRYRAELRTQAESLERLRARAATERVTLLYGARDAQVNHAVVLRDVLRRSPRARRGRDRT